MGLRLLPPGLQRGQRPWHKPTVLDFNTLSLKSGKGATEVQFVEELQNGNLGDSQVGTPNKSGSGGGGGGTGGEQQWVGMKSSSKQRRSCFRQLQFLCRSQPGDGFAACSMLALPAADVMWDAGKLAAAEQGRLHS